MQDPSNLVYPLQSRTDFTLLAADFGGGSTLETTVARRVPAGLWTEAIIVARVHDVSPYDAGAVLTLLVQPDPFTRMDPSIRWAVPSKAPPSVSWTQGADSVPQAKLLMLTPPFGPLIMVLWQLTMANTPVDTTYSVSIDVNLKGR